MRVVRHGLVLALLATCPASGDPLAPGAFANVFVLGDARLVACDVQGELALGGTGAIQATDVGGIVAGGDLGLVAVNVPGGILHGGNLSSRGGAIGPVSRGSSPGINLAGTGATLGDLSAYYNSLPPGGIVSMEAPGLLLLRGADPHLNVFAIAPPPPMTEILVVVPSSSTAVVNVAGTSPEMMLDTLDRIPGAGGGAAPSLVLFNFPEAMSLHLTSDAISGTILAPWANVTTLGVNMQGTMIAGGLTATSSSFADIPFAGPLTVPEPPSSLLVGLALFVVVACRMARQPYFRFTSP